MQTQSISYKTHHSVTRTAFSVHPSRTQPSQSRSINRFTVFSSKQEESYNHWFGDQGTGPVCRTSARLTTRMSTKGTDTQQIQKKTVRNRSRSSCTVLELDSHKRNKQVPQISKVHHCSLFFQTYSCKTWRHACFQYCI